MNLRNLAERFCAAPLPEGVCSDMCSTMQGPGRTGTNLLTVEQAEAVLGYTLGALPRAARDVLVERQRQIEAEGWTPEHDDRHVPGQLALAAAAYAVEAEANLTDPEDAHPIGVPPEFWPWSPAWWKPTDARRDLVKAAALILAEIERLDRRA